MTDTAPIAAPAAPQDPTPPSPPSATAKDLDVSAAFKDVPADPEPTAINRQGNPVGQTAEQKQAAFYKAIEGKSPEEVVQIAAQRGVIPKDPTPADVQVAPKETPAAPAAPTEFDMATADKVLQAVKDKKQQGDPVTPVVQPPIEPQAENQSETLTRISELEQAIETEKAQRKADEFTNKERVNELEYQVKAKDETIIQLRNENSKYSSNLNLYEAKDPHQKNVMESVKAYTTDQSEDNLYGLLGAMAQYWNALTKQDISAHIVNLKEVVGAAKASTAANPSLVNYAQGLKVINEANSAEAQKANEDATRKAKALNVG